MNRTGMLVTALLMPVAIAGQDTETTWNWSGSVGDGKWVRVASINGPIVFESSTDGRVHVTAEKRWTRGDPRRVRLEVVERDGNVTICALWHEDNRCESDGARVRVARNNDRNDVAVHFRVRVPPTANVAPTTVNGAIRVTGTGREVRATTVNGGIDIATAGGPATATTVNGSIRASVRSPGDNDLRFTTVNGGIDLAVPRDISAEVSMTTVNGSISSDFPLHIRGRWGPRSASGTLGSGAAELKMTTVNGSLTLRTM